MIVALPGNGSVRLDAGGIATSGSSRRRWMRGGAEQHHLIDPATGRPARVPWDEVTVAAGTCAAADVAAKAAFLLGWDGPVWLDERGLPGRFLTRRHGRPQRRVARPRSSGGWQRELAWYVARSGGMVAFGLLTASVLLGILLAGRKTLPRWPRFAVEDVHRFAGTLTWTFIGVHVAGLLVDTYIGFSLRQVLIPFTSSYRPAATAAGIVGAELLAAIGITNR